MKNIRTAASHQTPEILFNYADGIITISGKSFPENVHFVYNELLDVLREYCADPQAQTTVNFNWLYYNTATSKIIVKMLLMINQAPTKLKVNWYCKKDFTMMIEKAEIIRNVMSIDINVLEPVE